MYSIEHFHLENAIRGKVCGNLRTVLGFHRMGVGDGGYSFIGPILQRYFNKYMFITIYCD